MREQIRRLGHGAVDRVREHVEGAVAEGGDEINQFIDQRLSAILSSVKSAADSDRAEEKIRSINEEDFLTFVPDRRKFSGVSTFLLGLLVVVMLPGPLKLMALAFFFAALVLFYFGYINRCKVDVPDGFEGVMCRFGRPSDQKARRGRNWLVNFADFCSFLVSQRDQVVDSENANFAADSASIGLEDQKVFRVTDPGRFVANTSPAAVMRVLDLYGSYNALRIITSIRDSRVKFTGRDNLRNVITALNQQLGAHDFGITVVRANMPTANNAILADLEGIRTDIRRIEVMKDEKQVRLEAEVKQVESEMRQKRKASRNSALDLQKEEITLQTSIAQQVNAERQEAAIKARRTLEMTSSNLTRAVENLKAKIEKVKAIRASFGGLQVRLDLRKAAIKRAVLKRMVPKAVEVVKVDGIGPGLGMSVGTQLFRRMLGAASPDRPRRPRARADARLAEDPGE